MVKINGNFRTVEYSMGNCMKSLKSHYMKTN